MEHMKNIAVGAAGMAVIAAACYGLWLFGSAYPLVLLGIVVTPFFIVVLWGFGRSLRESRNAG